MANTEDIRWQQRLQNYSLALQQLEQAVQLASERELSNLEKQGLIQAFEFTHELAWNLMKDYAYYQGNAQVGGSRDATREAFKLQLITAATEWMDMIASRNQSSHTYNASTAEEIVEHVIHIYFPLMKAFQLVMTEKRDGEQGELF